MNIVQRVQDILLKPKETWPAIDAEGGDTASIYKNYLIYLALVPAVAGFIGLSLIGVGVFGVSYRVPLISGLANMVVGYVMSLVMVFVVPGGGRAGGARLPPGWQPRSVWSSMVG